MGNMTSENSRSFDLDLPQSTTPDTDRFLLEATEARERGIAGKTRPNESAAALEALNNIFKAFNTVAEMGSSQVDDPQEVVQDTKTEDVADAPVITDQNPGQDHLQTEVKTEQEPESKDPVRNSSERKEESYACNPAKNLVELSRKVQRKIHFFPSYDCETQRIKKIHQIKTVLSRFKTYGDLLSYINDYIDAGNVMDSELFLLYHSIYTLNSPEKYYMEFRRNMFSNNRVSGGKLKQIDKFLGSITSEPES